MRHRFAVALPTLTALFVMLAVGGALIVAFGAAGWLPQLHNTSLALALMGTCAVAALTAQFAWPRLQRANPGRPLTLGLAAGLALVAALTGALAMIMA